MRRAAAALTEQGMARFRLGDVEGSLVLFNEALSADPHVRPFLWQRGLSLYYLGRYAEAARQFRDDVVRADVFFLARADEPTLRHSTRRAQAVNPNDTEEAIWALLAESRLDGFSAAQKSVLRLAGEDSRPVMRCAYAVFAGSGVLESLRYYYTPTHAYYTPSAGASPPSPHDVFYARLYEGLFHEARGDEAAARAAVVAATDTPYATTASDYMAALSRVHRARRGW